MGIQTFNSSDPEYLARLREQEEIEKQDAFINERSEIALRGEQAPETFTPGTDVTEALSWDHTPGNEERRAAELRSMRFRKKNIRPQLRFIRDDGVLENVAVHDLDLKVYTEELACARCGAWHEPGDVERHREQHQKLQDVTKAKPPAHVPLSELCAFCGARVTDQKYTA